MADEVVKVQIPIASNKPNAGCLVYNKNRSKMVEQLISVNTMRVMMDENTYKAYFYAEWNYQTSQWKIKKRAPEQPW